MRKLVGELNKNKEIWRMHNKNLKKVGIKLIKLKHKMFKISSKMKQPTINCQLSKQYFNLWQIFHRIFSLITMLLLLCK
jgi:hypothetical protein